MKTIVQEIPGDGWHILTTAEFTATQEIDVVTRRTLDGELITTAQVWRLESDGTRRHSLGIGVVGDFQCTVDASRSDWPTPRDIVQVQHNRALERLEVIRADAVDHYLHKQYGDLSREEG